MHGYDTRHVLVLFVIGIYDDPYQQPLPHEVEQELWKEEEHFGDMLITSCPNNDKDYSDMSQMSFFWEELPTSSTNCKSLEAFKFAHAHVEYEMLARMGDDMYMNLKHFFNAVMPRLPHRRLYFGRMAWPSPHTPIIEASALYGLRDYPEYRYAIGIGIIMTWDVVSTLARMDSEGIPLRQTAPEDVVIAIWLMGFEVHRRNTLSMFNHPDSNSHVPNDAHRGYCNRESLAIHYVFDRHLADIRQSDGVMMCRQQHRVEVTLEMTSEDPDKWHAVGWDEIESIRVTMVVRPEDVETEWWQRDFASARSMAVRLVYTNKEQGQVVEEVKLLDRYREYTQSPVRRP